MADDKLKIVLVGCGSMSGAWLRPAIEVEGVEVVGLVDVNESAAANRAAEFGLTNAFITTDFATALDKASPDIVFDCSPPNTHTEVTVRALTHGSHVLGEKPLADTFEHAKQSVEAASSTGKVYAVMQNRRYDWRIRRIRRIISGGEIGSLTTLDNDFYIGAHFGGFRDHMKHVLLLDMAIHTFDAARFVLDADPVSVWAREWNPKGSWYEHDASAVAYFEMSNGIVYTYRGSWCSEGLNTKWEADWRIIGTNGSMKWDGGDVLIGQKVESASGFKSELTEIEIPERSETDKDGGHSGVIQDFIRCIRTGETPETIASDNIKSLAMVFAAIESSETGKVVPIVV